MSIADRFKGGKVPRRRSIDARESDEISGKLRSRGRSAIPAIAEEHGLSETTVTKIGQKSRAFQ